MSGAGLTLPDAAEMAAALGRVLPPSLAGMFDASFIRSATLYDEFIHRLVLGVFHAAGLEPATREPRSAEEIATLTGLDPARARIPLDWMLRQLVARDVLDERLGADGAPRFRARRAVPALDPAPVLEEQREHDVSWLPSYLLAETVARDYPAFLRGKVTGEQILFSPARFHLWLDYFSNANALYAVNNRVGAVAAEAWLPHAAARVLELGAGLGSGTIALLERFEAVGRLGALADYRVTELVASFLRRGQRNVQSRFPAVGVRFDQLDMNRPFSGQGVAPGSLTLVYAVNTLHVAHDLHATLQQIYEALEPGALLVISECVRPRPGHAIYVEFIFNLMETFRAPILHPGYRPNGGFLTPEQWTAAMEAAGFRGVRFLPDIVGLREAFPQFYVAAIGARRPA